MHLVKGGGEHKSFFGLGFSRKVGRRRRVGDFKVGSSILELKLELEFITEMWPIQESCHE